MSTDEFLAQMGLTQPGFTDLLTKFQSFVDTLDASQKAALQKSVPTLDQAAKTFGPGVAADDLQQLFDRAPSASVVLVVCGSVAPPCL